MSDIEREHKAPKEGEDGCEGLPSGLLSLGDFMRMLVGYFNRIKPPGACRSIRFLPTPSSTYQVVVPVGKGGRAPSRVVFLSLRDLGSCGCCYPMAKPAAGHQIQLFG